MTAEAPPSRDTAARTATTRPPGPVDRAFSLLQLVVASPQPIGVRDLARQAGLAPSTTARTLGILSDLGMVDRTPSGAAVPGAALATLTHQVGRSPASLRDRYRPLTIDLITEFGENAAIAVDDHDSILYVVGSRIEGALQVPDPTGDRLDPHLVATGLIAMAFWDDKRLKTYLARPIEAATTFSIVKPREIRSRVARVREDGFAWTNQELDLDVNGLAVPILTQSGDLLAIASLYGPAHRFNPKERPDLGEAFRSYVHERTSQQH